MPCSLRQWNLCRRFHQDLCCQYPSIHSACPTAPIQTYYDLTFWRCVQNCSADPQKFAHNLTCLAQCPSPTYGDALLGTCVASCSLSTYYMVYTITRLCVNKCYPNFYANSTRYCIAAADCPATPVPTFADDSTGLCVQGIYCFI